MSSLEALGFGPFFSVQFDLLNQPLLVPARVISDGRNCYHLGGCRASLGDLTGRLRDSLTELTRPTVGDWVAVTDDAERAIIHHVLDRRSAMVRRTAGTTGARQVVAANVDDFFIVTSANRDFSIRRLERYLAAIWDSGASPVIVLSKIDLAGPIDAMLEDLRTVALGAPVLRVSALTGEGMEELENYLSLGKTVGLVGSSGVGKSSIINRLLGQEVQETKTLRWDERGRHATTRRQLFELKQGGILIDTPGMRELGLVDQSDGMEMTFADVAELAKGCRFIDCRHENEPECAVRAAIECGGLDPARLESYHKIQREMASASRRQDPLLAGNDKRRWKTIAKSQRAHSKLDPKQR